MWSNRNEIKSNEVVANESISLELKSKIEKNLMEGLRHSEDYYKMYEQPIIEWEHRDDEKKVLEEYNQQDGVIKRKEVKDRPVLNTWENVISYNYQRVKALLVDMRKRKKELESMYKVQWKWSLTKLKENREKETLSEKNKKICEQLFLRYGYVVIIDKVLLDKLSVVVNNPCWAGSWWEIIWVYSGDLPHFAEIVVHEAIHGEQQKDIWSSIKKWVLSLNSYRKRRNELTGLVDYADKYAAQNQFSERETYINQHKLLEYLETRESWKFLEIWNSEEAWKKAISEYYREELEEYEKLLLSKRNAVDRLKMAYEQELFFQEDERVKGEPNVSEESWEKVEMLRKKILIWELEVKKIMNDIESLHLLQEVHFEDFWNLFPTYPLENRYIYDQSRREAKDQHLIISDGVMRFDVVFQYFIDETQSKYSHPEVVYAYFKEYVDEVMKIYAQWIASDKQDDGSVSKEHKVRLQENMELVVEYIDAAIKNWYQENNNKDIFTDFSNLKNGDFLALKKEWFDVFKLRLNKGEESN